MNLRLIRLPVLVTALLAGCSGRGCVSQERVYVNYRGPAVLSLNGRVEREKAALGYIKDIGRDQGFQRVELRVAKAAQLHLGDRFVPLYAGGLTGFTVIAGEGRPLVDGDEIEADSSFAKRAYYASLRRGMPGGITLPSGQFVPYPSALTREDERGKRRAEKFSKGLENQLRLPERKEFRVSAEALRRYEDLTRQLKGQDLPHANQILQSQGSALVKTLEKEQEDAMIRRDRGAARDARVLQNKVRHLSQMVSRQVTSEARRGPPRENRGYVPPDLR